MIRIENVFKDYKIIKLFEGMNIHKSEIIPALKGVSFTIPENKICALIGRNGAGKTTFLKILTTLILKDSGKIYYDNNDIDKDETYFKNKIAFLNSEERSFYFRLTLYENLQFFMGIFRNKIVNSDIDKVLKQLDLYEYRDKPFRVLSSGMKAKAQIARAFLKDPKVLLLDEPFSNIDYGARQELLKFLKHWVLGSGKHLLITSHHIEEIEDFIEKVIIFKEGKVFKEIEEYQKEKFINFIYNDHEEIVSKKKIKNEGFSIKKGLKNIIVQSLLARILGDENKME